MSSSKASGTPTAVEDGVQDTKGKPIHSERLAFVDGAVWENEVGDEGRTRFKVTISKSYKDAEGKWQRTGSLDAEDIPYAIKVLDRCHTWMAEERYRRASATRSQHE